MSTTAPALPECDCQDTFPGALREWGLQFNQRCLLIVDAAQFAEHEITRALYDECSDPEWRWLFENSPLEGFANAGPIVVDTTADSSLCRQAITQWAEKGLLFVFTENDVDSAVAGLRALLSADLETSGPCLLRPYDTRFLQVLSACQPGQMADLFTADSTWVWSVDLEDRVQWSGFRATSATQPAKIPTGHDFERLISWVAGWPECQSAVARDQHADATTLTRFIVHQWHSGLAWDNQSAEFETQWKAFRDLS